MSSNAPVPQLDFISQFIELTTNFESPTSFWKWSSYGAIAATLRFNCYLKWGTSNLYPNMYILLLADSASYRKDAAPELVEELLRECGHTKVISGRASWQGIVDELSLDIGNKKTGVPIKHGAGIIIAKEFTAFFVDDPNLVKMMTEGYAFTTEFEYTLRGGKTKIKNRCISLLGGSNETLLRDFYNTQASYGGLLRRTLLIKPDGRRPPNALMEAADHMSDVSKKLLVSQLKEIQKLSGEFYLTNQAKQTYVEFYKDLYHSYDKITDKSGFVEGAHSLIMKLAMVLAASNTTLEISDKTITRAIKEILDLKENYTIYLMGTGKNPHADMSAKILAEMWILNGTNYKRREMLLKHWNEISSEELDKLVLTLTDAGLIKMIPLGHEPSYILTDKAKEIFLKNAKITTTHVN